MELRDESDYQACQMQLQMTKEKIFMEAAKTMKAEKILIVCDRGQLDNKAYMKETEFISLMDRMGWEEVQLRDEYDAVFHLVTAAKGAQEYYTTANNAARKETVEKRLSQREYLELLMEADTKMRQICKTRYCLTYEGQYFEIDVYPFWKDQAIAELELNNENEKIVFPPQIQVIKEVTDDPVYKNASLAAGNFF